MTSSSNETDIKPVNGFVQRLEYFNIFEFILKLIKFWWILALFIILGYAVSYVYNRWIVVDTYSAITKFHVSDNAGNAFSGAGSVNLIWGGVSDKVGRLTQILTSRDHNAKVVLQSGYMINYHSDDFFKLSSESETKMPFKMDLDLSHHQLINHRIFIEPMSPTHYQIRFDGDRQNGRYHFMDDQWDYGYNVPLKTIKAPYGKWITTQGFRFKINKTAIPFNTSKKFSFILSDLQSAIDKAIKNLNVGQSAQTSILDLEMRGDNVDGIVDFVNASVELLKIAELDDKNRVAYNTINFIKSRLTDTKERLDKDAFKLQDIKQEERMFNISSNGVNVLSQITQGELTMVQLQEKLNALNQISNGLSNSSAEWLTLLSIDPNTKEFGHIFDKLKELEYLKSEKSSIYQPDSPPMIELEKRIQRIKNEISMLTQQNKRLISGQLEKERMLNNQAYQKLQQLPKVEQRIIYAQKDYTISDNAYNSLITKMSEAELLIAANVSDVEVIDLARNIHQSPIYPNRRNNTIIILAFFILVPISIFILMEFFNEDIRTIEDVERASEFPLVGILGKGTENLMVLHKPKSYLSEEFRKLRSNIRYLNPDLPKDGKIILITSMNPGEGKTFTSMNLASVISMSNKKTLLLGMDLRRPRIFYDFGISNKIGLTNYLVMDKTLEECIHKTKYNNLDIIPSGPIPPNPSELILSTRMQSLLLDLRNHYDYIILDTPPVGIVVDAFELFNQTDINLFVVRHNITPISDILEFKHKLKTQKAKNIGVVLNEYTPPKYSLKQRYYGYNYYDDEPEDIVKTPILSQFIQKITLFLK